MLVLTRRPGESIHIGEHVTITVLRLAHGRVRIGIDAPDKLPVCRPESRGPGQTLADFLKQRAAARRATA